MFYFREQQFKDNKALWLKSGYPEHTKIEQQTHDQIKQVNSWLKNHSAQALLEDSEKHQFISSLSSDAIKQIAINNIDFMRVFFPILAKNIDIDDVQDLYREYRNISLSTSNEPGDADGAHFNHHETVEELYIKHTSPSRLEAFRAYKKIKANIKNISNENKSEYTQLIHTMGRDFLNTFTAKELMDINASGIDVLTIMRGLNSEHEYQGIMLAHYLNEMFKAEDDYHHTHRVDRVVTTAKNKYSEVNRFAQSYVTDIHSYTFYINTLKYYILNEESKSALLDFVMEKDKEYQASPPKLSIIATQSDEALLSILKSNDPDIIKMKGDMSMLDAYYKHIAVWHDNESNIDLVPNNMIPYVKARLTLWRHTHYIPTKPITFEEYQQCIVAVPSCGEYIFNLEHRDMDKKMEDELRRLAKEFIAQEENEEEKSLRYVRATYFLRSHPDVPAQNNPVSPATTTSMRSNNLITNTSSTSSKLTAYSMSKKSAISISALSGLVSGLIVDLVLAYTYHALVPSTLHLALIGIAVASIISAATYLSITMPSNPTLKTILHLAKPISNNDTQLSTIQNKNSDIRLANT